MLSAGNEMPEATRAGNISYMPTGIRFTSMMLIRMEENLDYKYGQPVNAYMIVDNEGAGNSLYYQSSYVVPSTEKQDSYHNDDDATIFYWQNRNTHGFIGYIDDYNKAKNQLSTYVPKTLNGWTTDETIASDDANKTKFIYTKDKTGNIYRWQQFEKIDLREVTYLGKSIDQMPDPLIAYAEKKPIGSAPESNRVYLTFRHQLAQIQVNLRGGKESANLDAEQIKTVELLGVSEYAYVFPYPEYGYSNTIDYINTFPAVPYTDVTDYNTEKGLTGEAALTQEQFDALSEEQKIKIAAHNDTIFSTTWDIVRQGTTKELLRKTMGSVIAPERYTEDQPYGTQFKMFEKTIPETNYLKSFDCIAFGNLEAIRITWNEIPEEQSATPIPHVITYKVTDSKFKEMESGKRYIYNLELQRGTLAVVRTTIDDWIPYTGDYSTSGSIDKSSN